MKIVVIGGTGRIGARLVDLLRANRHHALAASPSTGVDALTGEGLADALAGAEAVVDVSNSPTFEERVAMDFFAVSTSNLLAAARRAGVTHYLALSIVGTPRLQQSPYFRAKAVQEKLISGGPLPFTILRATQFFEFVRSLTDVATTDGGIHLAPVDVRPMAADDVAAALEWRVAGAPAGGVVEVAGPEQWRLDELVRAGLRFWNDDRPVVTDPLARYFGSLLTPDALLPGPDAQVAPTRFAEWLSATAARSEVRG